MKRLLSLVLCFALLLSIPFLSVSAADIVDSGTCGENLTWTLDSDGVLTISGTGAMDDYSRSPWGEITISPWTCASVAVETVVIENGITSIGDEAFCNSSDLTSVTIPPSVEIIGARAFEWCTGLTNVAIPFGVARINESAFRSCTSLTNITIPESVTTIESSAFEGCTDLTSISIPKSVKYIGNIVFLYCDNLSGIWVDGNNPFYSSDEHGILFNKDKTELICCHGGFSGAYTVSSSVTSIELFAFGGCTGLTSISIPKSVTSISFSAFSGCTGLTSVTIPESINYIEMEMFSNCTGLKSIIIPESVTSIDSSAFVGCTSLKSVVIPSSVASIGSIAFLDCIELKSVCFMGDAPDIGRDVFTIGNYGARSKIPGLTLYYIEGKEGWTTPTWGEDEYPTATWDGVNVPQPPHEHSYTAVVTAPTCTAQGYTTHTCACGESYKDAYTDALGHNYKNGACTRCGAKDPSYKPDDKPVETIEFSDVSPTAWYAGAVGYAVSNKLMNGMGGGKFEPNGSMTRAMLVTVLWRYAGSPAEGTNGFSDVPNGDWYTQAVAWASKNGVVNGVGNGRFAPNGKITREQMAVILFRYANQQSIDTGKRGDFDKFADANRVSSYAVDALQWAVAEGIVGGSSEGGKLLLNPQGNATRAEVATILMRFLENVMK